MDTISSSQPMTVSEVLGAHAAAQMAMARSTDQAAPPARPAGAPAGSFIESWASASMCIGWAKPADA